jgi:threonine/homoserine/homoserine lactone efflux protein
LELLLSIGKGVWYGFLIGLLSFGPSFFTLIHTGIQGGKKQGMQVALGIFLSEMSVALLCFFGLSRYFTTQTFQLIFTALASLTILYLGFQSAFAKHHKLPEIKVSASASVYRGFFMNIINPFVMLLWVSVIATLSVGGDANTEAGRTMILIELITILCTLLALDLGKVYLSDYIGKKLSERVYRLVNRYFGAILLAIGLYFAYHFVVLLNAWYASPVGH